MKMTVVALLAGLALVGCSPEAPADPKDQAPSTVTRDSSYKAEVDDESGSVVLPLEKYFMNRVESGLEFNANILQTMLCMSEQGLPAQWSQYGEPSTQEWERYGRWNLTNAQSYGYLPVPDNADAVQSKSVAWAEQNMEILSSAEYDEALAECTRPVPQNPINIHQVEEGAPLQVQEMRSQSYHLMMATDEARAILAEREECLTERGFQLESDGSDFLPVVGARFDTVDEASIKSAIADVQCKQEIDLVQRLADIEASFQGPVAQKHQAELTALRSEIDTKMDNVNTFLAQNSARGEALR